MTRIPLSREERVALRTLALLRERGVITADGELHDDLAVRAVLTGYREEVADATERACQALRALGIDDPGRYIMGPRP